MAKIVKIRMWKWKWKWARESTPKPKGNRKWEKLEIVKAETRDKEEKYT